MLMIIAPSKTQKCNRSFNFTTTQPVFLSESTRLINELKKNSVSDLATLMKMSEALATQTFKRISAFVTPFNRDNSCPAISFFQGDVYAKIYPEEYGAEERVYLQNHLRILSGLYGILRPMDLMQAYRLEMGCKLKNIRGKNLYEFWGERITVEVNTILENQEEPVLVNLASAEYSRAVLTKALRGTVLQIDFKERKGDTYRTVAIHAKRARGMMVDFAVKNKIQNSFELQGFRKGGYCYRAELSTAQRYCFTRE